MITRKCRIVKMFLHIFIYFCKKFDKIQYFQPKKEKRPKVFFRVHLKGDFWK